MIVTPACAADTETEVLVAHGAPERGLLPLVGHVSIGGGRVFLQVLVVQTRQRLLPVAAGKCSGGVVPSPANEGGQTAGPGLRSGGLLCGSRRQAAGRIHLRTCGRCESGTGGIHDNVGLVRCPDEKLQACDLVVLVHSSHVPETRGKVPGGRTFMQNCVKRSRG